MTQFKFLAATIILAAFIATPSLAQRMIEEPGMFAFTYPNGDLGIGSTRPPLMPRLSQRSMATATCLMLSVSRARPSRGAINLSIRSTSN